MATIETKSSQTLIVILVLILVAGGVYYFLNGKDNRTTGDRVGDAVDSLSSGRGIGESVDQLGDKTPAEKAGDAIESGGTKIKKELNGN